MKRRRFLAALPAVYASAGRPGVAAVAKPAEVAAPAAAEGFDIPFKGYYETASTRTPLASAQLRFEPAGQSYGMSLDVDSLLARLWYESQGRLDARGLHPEHYLERRVMPFGRRRQREVRFVDRATAEPDALVVPAGTQDRISLVGQLWRLGQLDAGPFHDGRPFTLPLASVRKVQEVTLQVDPPAPLVLGGHEALAWRVHRIDAGDGLDVEIWLSAHGRREPLGIRFTEGDRALRFEAIPPG